MNKLDVTKKVVNLVSSHAAGFTTARVLVANCPVKNGSLYEKACLLIGAVVIGSMVGEATGEYTDKTIDKIVHAVQTSSAPTTV